MQSYILTARAKEQANSKALEYRRSQAMEVAQEAAKILRSQFGATRVVLFGSVLSDPANYGFHQGSDIDLAVWGISDRLYFKAVGKVQGLSEFAIDVVEPEDAPSYILEAIAKGVEL
ncbi:putative nucleotidyltransferase [Synechococcus sp. PCC 7502]|uniref:nucleotidyltransferase family protein n=1 Tax=Synechococcus sp. PCC 7502 TaxID=1173263 RepID=UPI00029FD870|nr:nucleotidyltransferase [Synechococcus sp. PCC 7502]AFY73454.1 putative nucleotidyltransferase [Synechococcus sp. PCC 7502]